jgi:hypothetical protein
MPCTLISSSQKSEASILTFEVHTVGLGLVLGTMVNPE